MIEGLRAIEAVVRKQTGRDLPMFATELGFNDDGDRSQELLQARAHVRSSLILLGEERLSPNPPSRGADRITASASRARSPREEQ